MLSLRIIEVLKTGIFSRPTNKQLVTLNSKYPKYRYALGLKAWPNARSISSRHLATLLGTTCCIRLATLLRYVATCWIKFENSQMFRAACWMLHDVVFVWPRSRSRNIVALGHAR